MGGGPEWTRTTNLPRGPGTSGAPGQWGALPIELPTLVATYPTRYRCRGPIRTPPLRQGHRTPNPAGSPCALNSGPRRQAPSRRFGRSPWDGPVKAGRQVAVGARRVSRRDFVLILRGWEDTSRRLPDRTVRPARSGHTAPPPCGARPESNRRPSPCHRDALAC